ncbi:MAG: beta-ketoacyl-[acyl-carrier-protein] synthase family protein [Thermoanaerobaculia bacterium]
MRIAITGIGILSALGRGVEEHVRAVREARCGVRTLERVDVAALRCRIGAEVPDGVVSDLPRDVDRVAGYALLAAEEAIEGARLAESGVPPERIGTVIGTALGGSETLDSGYARLYREGQSRMPPMTIPRIMYNAPASAIAARWKALGPAYATVSACASSTHAIGQAAHWIRFGLADAAIAGGSDAPFTTGILRAWEALRVLAPSEGDPARACRPFSIDRTGLVIGEGAAVFVLERMDRARERGAPILGEIAGFGMSSDGGHPTDPSTEGEVRAIAMALADAAIEPGEIGYVNAHGTATQANDVTETRAIHAALGAAAATVPVSSTKAMHGHAMGASGAIETALSLAALNAGVIPPTLNLERPDPACNLAHVALQARPAEVRAFLSSSFAFGGLNAVLALRTARGAGS